MRLIDADELVYAIREHSYPVKYDYGFTSCDLGMSLDGIEQAINEAPTMTPERDKPKPPIPDENATGIDGKPVPRCQVCGYALDLRMEQYCPCCGQRLTEYEVKE